MQITRPVPDARRCGSAARAAAHRGQGFTINPFHQLLVAQSLQSPADIGRSVVDQYVESIERVGRRSDSAFTALGFEQVGHYGDRLDTFGLDLHLGIVQCCFVAATDCHVGPLIGEAQRNCLADASIAAGDENGLPAEI